MLFIYDSHINNYLNDSQTKPHGERREMRHYKKYQNIEEQMQIIKTFFSQYFKKTMSKNGLGDAADFSFMELKALSAFSDVHGAYTVSALSKNAYMPLSNMTSIISRLERKHMVRKSRTDKDQRIVRVCLTDEGKKIFYKFMKKRVSEIEDMIGRLSFDKQQELFSALERAAAILKSLK
jgi:DNA-binding MarR family transcriptional regulator